MSRFRVVNAGIRRPTQDQPKTNAAGSLRYSSGEQYSAGERAAPFGNYAKEVYRGEVADYVLRLEDGEAVLYRIDGRSETGAERGEMTTGGGDTIKPNAGLGTPMAKTGTFTEPEKAAQDRALGAIRRGTQDAFGGDPRATLRQIAHAREARAQHAGLREINARNRRRYDRTPPDAA
jgi:hypothetical protein